MEDIIKILKSLEDSGLLLKGVTETIQNEVKEQKGGYYQNEPRFNGVYSRDNITKIKDGTYAINLDEYSDIGTHWFALYVRNNNVTYFDSFGVEHVPK